MENHAVASGILSVGSDIREYHEWARWYYEYKGWNFANIRRDIIDRYVLFIKEFSFRELYIGYVDHLVKTYRAELCNIPNDNDMLSDTLAAWYPVKRGLGYSSSVLSFPAIQWHPLAHWRGERISKFGFITLEHLIQRISAGK